MELDKEKVIKLVIVALVAVAALAVMSILVQVIQTVLPFLIVGAGVYAGYRWALSEAPAPTADEVEEQARGIFSRFRRTKKAVETTMKVGEALNDLGGTKEKKAGKAKPASPVVEGEATNVDTPKAETAESAVAESEAGEAQEEAVKEEKVSEMKQALGSNPGGAIEFKDHDVVISSDDLVQPDISRLEEKEKEEPKVTNNVLAQIEQRRRRLQGGE